MPTNPARVNREPAEGPLTLEGFLARSPAGPSTIAFYRDELARFERRLGANLATTSTRSLERLKESLRTTRSGPTRCRLLRQFFKAAGQEDRAGIFKLKRAAGRLPEKDILTVPEINKMLAAARSLRDRAFLAVMWESGARVSEVLSLDVGDVRETPSPENGGRRFVLVFFRKVKVKGEEHESLLIEGGAHVRAWLEAYAPEGEDLPLFPSGRGENVRLTRDGAERVITKTAARAGIKKHVYAHLFRHSRATHLLRIGVPEAQVAKLLGWRSTRMIERYSHLAQRDARDALLKAHGLAPTETPTLDKLASVEDLLPVVPIRRAPEGGEAPKIATEDLEAADEILDRDDIHGKIDRYVQRLVADELRKSRKRA